jgi:hypothetical protein
MPQISDKRHVLLRGAAEIEKGQPGLAVDVAEEFLQAAAGARQVPTFAGMPYGARAVASGPGHRCPETRHLDPRITFFSGPENHMHRPQGYRRLSATGAANRAGRCRRRPELPNWRQPVWRRLTRLRLDDIDAALEISAVFDDDAGRADVAEQFRVLADLQTLEGFHVALYGSQHQDFTRLDRGLYGAVRADGQLVFGGFQRAFHRAVHVEVFLAVNLADYLDRFSD